MKEIHLAECPSTQEYLKKYLADPMNKEKEVLVSAGKQTQGVGRGGNNWDHFPLAVAFSFTLSPQATPSLTALEVGVLLCQFFAQKKGIKLGLKWPNDLFTLDEKKCGGMIIQVHSPQTMIVGVGINLQDHSSGKLKTNYKNPVGFVGMKVPVNFQNAIPQQIVDFIHRNRLEVSAVIPAWTELCVHQEAPVIFEDGEKKISGIFKGLGPVGEAIIENEADQKTDSYISGHLFLDF